MSDPQTFAVIDFETTGMSPAMGARATEIAVVLVQDGRTVDRYASLMRSGTWVPPFIEQLTGISNRMLAAAPPAAEVMAEVADFCRGAALVAHNASFDRGFWQHEMALAQAEGRLADVDAGRGVPEFGCTLLLSRRLWPEVPNHKLGTLARWHGITATGRAHRARAEGRLPVDAVTLDASGVLAASVPEFGCTLLLSRRLWPEVPNHKLGTLARWHGITATGRAHRALADAEMAAELWLRITDDVQKRYAASVPFGLLCALQRTPRQQLARCVERYFAQA